MKQRLIVDGRQQGPLREGLPRHLHPRHRRRLRHVDGPAVPLHLVQGRHPVPDAPAQPGAVARAPGRRRLRADDRPGRQAGARAAHLDQVPLGEPRPLPVPLHREQVPGPTSTCAMVLELDDQNVVGFYRHLLSEIPGAQPRGTTRDLAANLVAFICVFLSLRGWNLHLLERGRRGRRRSTTSSTSSSGASGSSARRRASEETRMMKIRKAAVLGAGLMGTTVAAHLANAGIPTLVLDLPPHRDGRRIGIEGGSPRPPGAAGSLTRPRGPAHAGQLRRRPRQAGRRRLGDRGGRRGPRHQDGTASRAWPST